jgi:hypothetical protein
MAIETKLSLLYMENFELASASRLFLFYFSFGEGRGWSETDTTITEGTTGLLDQHKIMIDDYECGAIGGMLGKRNRSTQGKPAPVPLCPPQLPHDLTRARLRAAAVGSRRLTA